MLPKTSKAKNVEKISKYALAGIVVFISVGIIWYFINKESVIKMGADFCPVDGNFKGYSMVLLDMSDKINNDNAEAIKKEIISIGRDLNKYGKISIFDIKNLEKELISLCSPIKLSECSGMSQNCSNLERKFKEKFESKVNITIADALSKQTESDSSPIIEVIGYLSRGTGFQETKENKRLFIFSDMLQHTGGFSHYGRVMLENGFEKYMKTKTDHYILHKPDLEGTSVSVRYILRYKNRKLQTESHREFWYDLFKDSGAINSDIKNFQWGSDDFSL